WWAPAGRSARGTAQSSRTRPRETRKSKRLKIVYSSGSLLHPTRGGTGLLACLRARPHGRPVATRPQRAAISFGLLSHRGLAPVPKLRFRGHAVDRKGADVPRRLTIGYWRLPTGCWPLSR